MSTRANVLVIEREHAENFEEGFAVDPVDIIEKSYINMYLHHDGYPSWRGVEIGNWIEHKFLDGWSLSDPSRVAGQIAHDFHYNSSFLYRNHDELQTNYTYIIWTKPKCEPWISIWNRHSLKCEFVGQADKLISKHKTKDMDYTDWNYKLNTNKDG